MNICIHRSDDNCPNVIRQEDMQWNSIKDHYRISWKNREIKFSNSFFSTKKSNYYINIESNVALFEINFYNQSQNEIRTSYQRRLQIRTSIFEKVNKTIIKGFCECNPFERNKNHIMIVTKPPWLSMKVVQFLFFQIRFITRVLALFF